MKIIIGISGGVDSSVAAYLLKQQGYDVQGLFMKNWEEDDTQDYCSATEDLKDAQAVCDKLDIPLHTANFSSEYWNNVFEEFLAEYKAGRTPNPDILCNREIKFKVFLEHAERLGADAIATGHYVHSAQKDKKWQLLRGLDPNKDQSYFLYTLGQQQLASSVFPVGEIHKPKVREIAEQQGFVTHDKKDSTGICFIGERPFREFLSQFIPAQQGDMISPEGEVIGQHQGVMYYTLGQRKGLQIGGLKQSSGEPWYVLGKDVSTNQLIVGQGHNHPLLFSQNVAANQLSWVSGQMPELPYRCTAKTRYRQTDQACTITEISQNGYEIVFEQPQRAVTPGQSIVFYDEKICLGGGIIEQAS
ncbi:tRNA 2-thiouridine(34) synthase MnmA [Candidatus Albibeggiatoa sp. nov. BB20]|uniref:tRNA 2-thiouridine(34) synthase MnmA n=1 Tax=Candidatus Albibeggiatoa sp. nov. BB20 TaxID=3162723 RepID=UPI0033655F5C